MVTDFKYFPKHTFEQLDVRGVIIYPVFALPTLLDWVSLRHYLLVFYSPRNVALSYRRIFKILRLAAHIMLVIEKFFFKLQNLEIPRHELQIALDAFRVAA